jgi:hypothetical protein
VSRLVEDALAALRAQGIAATVEHGRHIKVRFTNAQGKRCLLVVAFSPSDRRAIKNSRAVLRRLLRRSA